MTSLALMKTSIVNLDLLRTNVAAKMRNTDLAFSMEEHVKAWYMAERGLILNQMPLAAAPTPMPTPTLLPNPLRIYLLSEFLFDLGES